jgi:hypothetical protein
MSTHEKPRREPTLDDNPGLEHDEVTPEGELMTADGSRIKDPNPPAPDKVTLENDPGLEHDETTEAGRKLTAEGSVEPRSKGDDSG